MQHKIIEEKVHVVIGDRFNYLEMYSKDINFHIIFYIVGTKIYNFLNAIFR